MATHLKFVFATCLLLLIAMEEFKPILAKKGEPLKQRTKILEKSVAELKDKIKVLEECQSCSKIKELNDTLNELQKKIDSKPTPVVAGLEDSVILQKDASYLEALVDLLKPVVQSDSHWKRCWQASQDGWEAATFHSLCDNKGPTVTIIRVGHKYILGGYTSYSWSSNCAWHYDSAAFLYSLVNYPGWQPVKLDQSGLNGSSRTFSIYSCGSNGPTFGYGHDIYIADLASSNTNSYSSLGYTYSPPPGYGVGSSFAQSFLAGSMYFQPDEVEVFYEST